MKTKSIGNRVSFYFTPMNTSKLDNRESFDSQRMKRLLTEIHTRGHEIGIHPGYETFDNVENFHNSASHFQSVLNDICIQQPSLGGND
eukprot:UN14917